MSFVLFALLMATLVTVCVREDVNLVSRNYYQEELKHGEKMIRIKNTTALAELPSFQFEEGVLKVSFAQWSSVESGKLNMIRPSDERLDLHFDVKGSNEKWQSFPVKIWEPGLYRVNLTWTMDGKEYFYEKMLVL